MVPFDAAALHCEQFQRSTSILVVQRLPMGLVTLGSPLLYSYYLAAVCLRALLEVLVPDV